MSDKKHFPNGFLSWFETSVEISEHMFNALEKDEIEVDGRGELWELIEDYTDEFEKKYEGIEWGSEEPYDNWFDVLDAFTIEKVNILKEQKQN